MSDEQLTLMQQLAAAFDPGEVKFKPAVVQGNRALALPYVDARVIQDRLDHVLGVNGWSDDYTPLADGSVMCRLRLRIGGEWVTKTDVGGPSEQPDGGDRTKAAFSDALKRAAVKFGIGRYLYRLPQQWVDYDPRRRQFTRRPELPGPKPAAPARKNSVPADGPELEQRLRDFERRCVVRGLCLAGQLVDHVRRVGRDRGWGQDVVRWSGAALGEAVQVARDFEHGRKAGAAGTDDGEVIDDDQRALVTNLLTAKNKTVAAALKSVASKGQELGDLTRGEYRLLLEKLGALPDQAKGK